MDKNYLGNNQKRENIPSHFNLPPGSTVNQPIDTKKHGLPFLELSWEDFEKLCYQLIRGEGNIEYCRRYGVPGQNQEGIDIYARPISQEEYMVFQCKRYKKIKASKLYVEQYI